MRISCPQCGFSRQIPPEQLPAAATRAHCPRCRTSFPLERTAPAPAEEVSAQDAAAEEPSGPDSQVPTAADLIPKAGFWTRLVAWVIDKILVGLLETILASLLLAAGVATTSLAENSFGSLAQLIWLFTIVVNMVYYVLFTGHCGQTPGKMAVRVKVIRRDGAPVSYGRAFFREVPGKFISAVLLGIGFLMIAFDDQKQGLHDRMADTYVIKL